MWYPFYSLSPCTLFPHINITVLVNDPTHWPCPLCHSNVPNWTYHYLTCLASPSNWLCPILCNCFTCMFQLDELSPSHWPNPPPPTGHTTDDSLVVENIVWILFAVGLKSTRHRNGSRKPLDFKIWSCYGFSYMYSTNHVYLHRPNAFGFWQMRLHLCYETLKRISNFSELA